MILDSYIYFYHLDKFCVLPDYPETVTDSMTSSFSDTNALARTAPVWSYNHSGPRTINLTLTMHRDMMNDLNRNVSNLKDNVVDFSGNDYIDTLVKYLQSVSFPRYNEYSGRSKSVIPPMVAVRYGNDIFIKGIVNSNVSVTYGKPILWNKKYAVVTVNFTIYEVEPFDADIIVQEGSFRGITRTFKDGIFKSTSDVPNYTNSNRKGTNNGETLTSSVRDNTTGKDYGKSKAPEQSTTIVRRGPGIINGSNRTEEDLM